MNHKELYISLVKLCDGTFSESFQMKDQILDGITYRIFSYHIASYTDFTHPNALEARGIMFRMDGDEPVLVCLPPKKFFNLYENPFTMDLDLEKIVAAMGKEDGSLISTYLHEGRLALKSKTSLFSEQVAMARDWLEQTITGQRLSIKLLTLALQGFTTNMELTSPMNRIVLAYPSTNLTVLNIRDLKTGETYYKGTHSILDKIIGMDWVEEVDLELLKPLMEFVTSIPAMTGIEGYVLRFKDGTLAKHKTTWYQALHHTKDSVNIPRRLFECIIEETVDDLKAMFHDDPFAIQTITAMEEKVVPIYARIRSTVEGFYEANKELSRKDYAIKGIAELAEYPGIFHLAMNLYLRKDANYKEFSIKNINLFGIRTEVLEAVDA